jgi:hypothetical protein
VDVLTRLDYVVFYEGISGPAIKCKVCPAVDLEGAGVVEEPGRNVSQLLVIVYRGLYWYSKQFTVMSMLGG